MSTNSEHELALEPALDEDVEDLNKDTEPLDIGNEQQCNACQ